MEGVFVNGPINVTRLEGEIFGIKKHIYIFMDFHNIVTHQTQCINIDSIDMSKYIIQQLKNSDKNIKYDIFGETYKTSLSKKDVLHVSPDNVKSEYSFRGRYIDEVNRLLSFESSSNKKTLLNVRYHYIDIRDYLKQQINYIFYNLKISVKKCISIEIMDQSNLKFFITCIQELMRTFDITYTLFDNYSTNKSGGDVDKTSKIKNTTYKYQNNKKYNNNKYHNDENNSDIIQKFINKIIVGYKHKEIPIILKELFDKINLDFIKLNNLGFEALNILNEFKITKNENIQPHVMNIDGSNILLYGTDIIKFLKLINELQITIYKMEMIAMYNYALIVDIFFLRRFLDKDYIQNAIVYTGISHSVTYIYVLIKLFNFKMTHISYIKNGTKIDTLKEFMNDKTHNDIHISELFYPLSVYQCSDMTDFPKHFK